MEHRQHNHTFIIFNKEDLVWKAACNSTSGVTVNARKLHRIPQYGVEDGIYTEKKLRAKTGNARLVPVERIIHFRFGFWANDETSAHRLLRIRSRTTPHGEPSFGFR